MEKEDIFDRNTEHLKQLSLQVSLSDSTLFSSSFKSLTHAEFMISLVLSFLDTYNRNT